MDGTLAAYHGWPADGGIGPPIPKMVARVRAWLAEGRDVRIFTARVSTCGQYSEESRQVANGDFARQQTVLIQDWCQQHIGRRLRVVCEKDFEMEILWDDRCVRVETNTGVVKYRCDSTHGKGDKR